MRKLLVALFVGLAVLSLSACGGSQSSLTSVQSKALAQVNDLLSGLSVVAKNPVVVGSIAKDGQGNKVVLVHETFAEKDASGKTQTYDLIIIIVTTQAGKLIFADVLLPSGTVTVNG